MPTTFVTAGLYFSAIYFMFTFACFSNFLQCVGILFMIRKQILKIFEERLCAGQLIDSGRRPQGDLLSDSFPVRWRQRPPDTECLACVGWEVEPKGRYV